MTIDVLGVDPNDTTRTIAGVIRKTFEQSFHDRMQASCADVLGTLVDVRSDLGKPANTFSSELDLDAFRTD
jgi:hypothetical protein